MSYLSSKQGRWVRLGSYRKMLAGRYVRLRWYALKPVALGVALAFPLWVSSMGRAWARPVPALDKLMAPVVPISKGRPDPFTVPVPVGTVRRDQFYSGTDNRADWVQRGQARLNEAMQNGRRVQTIEQASQRSILNWQSFDIGSQATVNFQLPNASAAALNRVSNQADPTQIFGQLKSYYVDAAGQRQTGGELFLINRNGILFGQGAQVNVGGLIASTLEVKDDDFWSGLVNSITTKVPTFKWEDAPGLATYADAANFVRVDPGAQIETASGGRVYLLAKNVSNAGTVRVSPQGQAVLAAGSEVYLQTPSAEPIYASEANPKIPAVRGLLVEVSGAGQADNAAGGVIEAAQGNVTIVGMAVNQQGRISSTTSVSDNGSVLLLARSGVAVIDTGSVTKRATQGGTLTLGAGSLTEIRPDESPDSQGKPQERDHNAAFTASRVELAGQTIQLQDQAQIVAPGGQVNVRAEVKPYYSGEWPSSSSNSPSQAQARLVLGAGAVIDVAGTTAGQRSVGDFFVTAQRLGEADFKDLPLHKQDALFHQSVNFDVRQAAPILGDTSSYKQGLKQTVTEKLAKGGTVSLLSEGSVLMHQSAAVKIDGGQIAYTEALVKPTVVVAESGRGYNLNQAPVNERYIAVLNTQQAQPTRFGNRPRNSAYLQGYVESGYVAGQDAGTLNVYAPQMLLDGTISGHTTVGRRQQAGLDAQAKRGAINLGYRKPNIISDSDDNASSALRSLVITNQRQALAEVFWQQPMQAMLPSTVGQTSRVAAQTLNDSGLGSLTISADGQIVQQDGAHLNLDWQSRLDWRARGQEGVYLGGDIVSTGGSVKIKTQTSDYSVGQAAGGIVLAAGRTLDVSGNWVNQVRDGASLGPAVQGGTIELLSNRHLVLSEHNTLNVSGGATLGVNGQFKGTNAGAIALETGNRTPEEVSSNEARFNANFLGYSLARGGSLRMRAGQVEIQAGNGGRGALPAVQNNGANLVLTSDVFQQGGFRSLTVEGVDHLTLAAGTTLAPRLDSWQPVVGAHLLASSNTAAPAMQVVRQPDAWRAPVDIKLAAVGYAVGVHSIARAGDVRLERGARLDADRGAKVVLAATRDLAIQGSVVAPGGQIHVLNSAGYVNGATALGQVLIGAQAVLDVSGVAVPQPTREGLNQGQVLAGGAINVSAPNVPLVVEAGAQLGADGAQGLFDLNRPIGSRQGVQVMPQWLASSGGLITLELGWFGASLAGTMHAYAGNHTVPAGSFQLTLGDSSAQAGTKIILQEPALTKTLPAQKGQVTLSSQTLSAGFDAVSLKASTTSPAQPSEIQFAGPNQLMLGQSLSLDAQLVSATAGSQVKLAADSYISLGSSRTGTGFSTPQPQAGSAQLSLQGGLVEWFGNQVVSGFNQLQVQADQVLRFRGLEQSSTSDSVTGSLSTLADVRLHAPLVYTTTASRFTLNAGDASAGRTVRFEGGSVDASVPLSAASQFTVNAQNIEQYGVVRAPLGKIIFHAGERLTLGAGSLTSVSGAGLSVPFGAMRDGLWQYLNQRIEQPQEKTITLQAAGKTITTQVGSLLDLSGGGELLAYEFIPGKGGSKDIFAGDAGGAFAVVPQIHGYAPYDAAIYSELAAEAGATPTRVQLGQQISFGQNGPVPAGTYAILPARYALLDGAFLIKPLNDSRAMEPGFNLNRADGSYVVAAKIGQAGTAYQAQFATNFVVMPSAVAQRYSEIRTTAATPFFTAAAEKAGQVAPRLPIDAGTLNILADKVNLAGQSLFKLPQLGPLNATQARGGEVNFAADRIHVAEQVTGAEGVMELTAQQLAGMGAQSILLGGQRQASAQTNTNAAAAPLGRQVNVIAKEVVVEQNTHLSGQDLILAATDLVEVKDRAQLSAQNSATDQPLVTASEPLLFKGDGALLRLSAAGAAETLRSDPKGIKGTLKLGEQVQLKAGTLALEATHSTQLAQSAQLVAQEQIKMAANKIALGQTEAISLPPEVLRLNTLSQQLGNPRLISLRAFDGFDFYGDVALGSPTQQALVLDAGQWRVHGADGQSGGQVRIEAGQVLLTNTTLRSEANSAGGSALPAAGAGRMMIRANGATQPESTPGHLILGPGQVALVGVQQTDLSAANSTILQGQGGLSSSGDLALQTSQLSARQQANFSFNVAGQMSLNSPAQPGQLAEPGQAAQVAINAASIDHQGRIVLPSGQLSLQASGTRVVPGSAAAIRLGAASLTDLSGRQKTLDGQVIYQRGGDFQAVAQAGNISLAPGAEISVSGATSNDGQSGADAGSIRLAAPQGAIQLAGTILKGNAAQSARSGQLELNSQTAIKLDQLAQAIAAGAAKVGSNLTDKLSIRNRVGDQLLEAQTRLSAHDTQLAADTGSLTIRGQIDANGQGATHAGGHIQLAAGQDVVLDGAQLTAQADQAGYDGGVIELQTSQGTLRLGANAKVNAAGGGQASADNSHGPNGQTGRDGVLRLRAPRSVTGQDVQIDPLAAQLQGLSGLEIEGVKYYSAAANSASGDAVLSQALQDQINTDAQRFSQASSTRLATLLAAQSPDLRAKAQWRPGAEVQSTGSLLLDSDWSVSYDALQGQARWQGAPLNLTLRAAGDLTLAANLSDGILLSSGAVLGAGGHLKLIGGADLSAADPLATRLASAATQANAPAGDVKIGAEGSALVVRSSTGDIDIAAARDIQLHQGQVAIYTTGLPQSVPDLPYFDASGDSTQSYTPGLQARPQSPVLTQGGAIRLTAGHSIQAQLNPMDDARQWFGWRTGDTLDPDSGYNWYARYDLFKNGLAAFGGGSIQATAAYDIQDLSVGTPEGGYIRGPVTQRWGGGDINLQAGHAVQGGWLLSGGGELKVWAGQQLSAGSQALSALYGDSHIQLQTRGEMVLGGLNPTGLVDTQAVTANMGLSAGFAQLWGTSSQARLLAHSLAGDISYQGALADKLGGTTIWALPNETRFWAPLGSISLVGQMGLYPSQVAQLQILAQQEVQLPNTLIMTGSIAEQRSPLPTMNQLTIMGKKVPDNWLLIDRTQFQGAIPPVQVVAEQGDIRPADSDSMAMIVSNPIRLLAGRDIRGLGEVSVVQQSDNALSLLQAGRDVQMSSAGNGAGVSLHGPGELIVSAGRDVELGISNGLVALGNREKSRLPVRGAGITVLAGVTLSGRADYQQAQARYFELLGGAGVADFAPDLAAQLQAVAQNQTMPQLGSAAARGFKTLPVAQQLQQARTLAGEAQYQQAVVDFMRNRLADAHLTLERALPAFNGLTPAQQQPLVGQVLAAAWVQNVPLAERQQQAIQMAAQRASGAAYAAQLADFVARYTGQRPASTQQALEQFQQLAPEVRLLLTNQVLTHEIQVAGERAAQLTVASDKQAAREVAYAAIATVFPGAKPTANIDMGSSQIKTTSQSPITLMTPHGGINVGQLSATKTTQDQAALGIVTAGGGNINMVVRDDVAVNTSRVFSVGQGDLLIWSSNGNIDAGKGAKTIVGAPPPVYYLDAEGHMVVDTSGSFSGSGIATLDERSKLYLFAPRGTIDAGDAGIRATTGVFDGTFKNFEGVSVKVATGTPPPAVGNLAAGLQAPASTTAGQRQEADKSNPIRTTNTPSLNLDFLGFGGQDTPPKSAPKPEETKP